MTSALKKNGPASPASDPDLGSLHPCKGKQMNAPDRSTMLTRRQALAGIAATPVAVAAHPAAATSPEQVEAKMEALAGQMNELLRQHPIQWLGTGGWAVVVYPRDELWYGYQQMPGNNWREPLVEAIGAYGGGRGESARHELDDSDEIDAYAEVTYEPPLAVLDGWDKPALTRAGAIAALRFAAEEGKVSWLPDGVDSMVKAALGYLESGRP